MTVTIAAPVAAALGDQYVSGNPNAGGFPDYYVSTLVPAGTSLTATDSTAVFTLPYITVTAKYRLVVNLATLTGGSSPTLTVTLSEDVASVATASNTAVATSGALSATGVTWVAAASGPI